MEVESSPRGGASSLSAPQAVCGSAFAVPSKGDNDSNRGRQNVADREKTRREVKEMVQEAVRREVKHTEQAVTNLKHGKAAKNVAAGSKEDVITIESEDESEEHKSKDADIRVC